MKINDKLGDLYNNYYEAAESPPFQKRAISAKQTVFHMERLLPNKPYGTLLDIGAGDGSVLAELSDRKFANHLHAVEISDSGVEFIRSRDIPGLESINKFDGYTIHAENRAYDIGTAIHVLEHVEHERAFLNEISRACRYVYIEVPLELTMRSNRAIRAGSPYGHINFYTPATFRNLLVTSGLEILAFEVFSHSKDYECHNSGPTVGTLKHLLRSSLLKVSPAAATFAMAYIAGAVCQVPEESHR